VHGSARRLVVAVGYREHELHQQHIHLSVDLAEWSIRVVEHLIRHHATISHPHSDLSEVMIEMIEVVMVVMIEVAMVVIIEMIDCITLTSNDDKRLYRQ
jgi:hypothetical protein